MYSIISSLLHTINAGGDMKGKLLTKIGVFGVCALSAVGFVGCGNAEFVTFGPYSGTYDNNNYSVASSTWEKQVDEEGFNGVWKLVGQVKYDDNTGKALYYGNADTKHYVAITVNHENGVTPENPTYFVNNNQLKPFDNGNENSFTLIKSIGETSGDFTLTINWNSQSQVKYKFILDKTAFTLEPAPQA